MILDLHVHTSRYSSCSRLDPDRLMIRAREEGLDGVCLTEHQVIWPQAEARDLSHRHGLAVFRGIEVTTTAGDVLVFGVDQAPPGVPTPEELKTQVDQARGIAILAHPFRGFLVFGFSELKLSVEDAAGMPVMKYVHGLESANGRVTDPENDLARQVAAHLGLVAPGGSDAHSEDEVGLWRTVLDEPAADETDLVRLLRSGRFRVVRRGDGI
jgi:predicted metal-dependent phosphoesterase TrpH